jgi:RimJ/RimL family protein N-acetyltransferase
VTVTIIETQRLVLRPWTVDDAEDLGRIFANPVVWHFPFGRGLTGDQSERLVHRQLDHWAAHGFGLWAAELKGENKLIGYIGLAVPEWLPQVLPAVEVGWRLHPDNWGKGLATEGGRASVRHGFETLGLEEIISIVQPGNTASVRVAEKLGFRLLRTTRDPERSVELDVFRLLRPDWENS